MGWEMECVCGQVFLRSLKVIVQTVEAMIGPSARNNRVSLYFQRIAVLTSCVIRELPIEIKTRNTAQNDVMTEDIRNSSLVLEIRMI